MKPLLALGLLGILVIGGGCGSRDKQREHQAGTGELLVRQGAIQTVELIDEAGLRKLVRERGGKMLLLNIWATWCVPCVEEFPDLVRLSQTYEDGNLEVVGISVDFPDEIESKVVPFLRKLAVPFKVHVAKFDKQEDFINAVNVSWNGAVPATFIYDSTGNQRFSLIGPGTYEQFRQEIENLNVLR